MDAREQLRQYLEQRREAGEHDLVLDGLSADDALRLLGAATTAARRPSARDAWPFRQSDQHSQFAETLRLRSAGATGCRLHLLG